MSQAFKLTFLLCAALLSTSCALRDKVQIAIGRHATIVGIQAKALVGQPVDVAIAKYGKPVQILEGKVPQGTVKHGVDLSGKDLWIFQQDRVDYTINVPVGTEQTMSNEGPVIVQHYEAQDRTGYCMVHLVVDKETRIIATYEVLGMCL